MSKVNKITKFITTTTLDDLTLDPSLAKFLSPEEAVEMLSQLGVVQGILLIQALSGRENEKQDAKDRLLNVKEVADRLDYSPDWVYRNANKLPFTRRLSSNQLRFSEKGLEKYIKNLPR
jgi:predicted DNA-binding transcriptional regulator AlpA